MLPKIKLYNILCFLTDIKYSILCLAESLHLRHSDKMHLFSEKIVNLVHFFLTIMLCYCAVWRSLLLKSVTKKAPEKIPEGLNIILPCTYP